MDGSEEERGREERRKEGRKEAKMDGRKEGTSSLNNKVW